ncbi:TIM-barrel enzyme family protein [Aspergillus candidus]|uniref:TIM-barrel enzyme family protein n=1 Tax=Aspergillus candidus TaxID=41067 RepID=A0A2I2FHC2_ASPCN|nr:TIM-barrel enzyme family protein [Aspergillus candidus]PLB40014.1 TIM-barrel enzyme family protein [Aspergillus candidus]
MPRPSTRQEVLARLRKTIDSGEIIVGAGAGIGLSAKFMEKGGADILIVYNSGRFRMAGRGSLAGMMPYSDANQVVVDMANEILPIVQNTPVLAGVCGTDPFRSMPEFLDELRRIGYIGVQNFPTVGLIDGVFRQNLEETGMGYDQEVEMIRLAHEKDLVTTPYAFNVDEGERMARAGADVIVVHLGLTTSGTIGAQTAKTLDDSVRIVQEVRDAVVAVNPEVIVLCHGGPLAGPEDAQYVLERTKGVHGFYGASSMERLPVETAILENARAFKGLKVGRQS